MNRNIDISYGENMNNLNNIDNLYNNLYKIPIIERMINVILVFLCKLFVIIKYVIM